MLAILNIVWLVIVVALAAGMARRVLGVPVGWPRSILVGFFILSASGAMAYLIVGAAGLSLDDAQALQADPAPFIALMVLAVVWAFLAGLVALVLLELFVPTGTVPPLTSLFIGWKARRRRARRYAQITAIAVKHGLGGYLRGRRRTAPAEGLAKTARSLTAALNEAGVSFIKFGQMMSTRPDLVPEVFTRELASLQTRADPEPWPRIEAAIAGALGRPIQEVFARVDPEPLASASVAQVHRAALSTGEEVALKVQRPDAQQQVAADTDILLRLARWLDRATAWGAALGVRSLAEGFAASLEEELDYTVELDNMRAVAGNMSDGESAMRVPKIYSEHCSRTLLVMEFVAGTPIGDAGAELADLPGAGRRELAERLVGEVLRQVTVSGVFHADLHMGNILLTPERGLVMLDLGSVGRLDSGARMSISMLLVAVDKGDSVAATDALIDLLDRPDDLAERRLEREVGQLLLRYGSGLGGRGSAELFAEMFPLILAHGFAVPPQVAAAFRALGALEGTLRVISPDIDLVQAARAQGRLLADDALAPANLKEAMEGRLVAMLPALQRLPRRVDKIFEDLEQGRFTVTVRPFADRQSQNFITGLVQQVVMALLAATATLGAILLITADTGPMLTANVSLYAFFGYSLLFVGFVLALRALVLVFQRSQPPRDRR